MHEMKLKKEPANANNPIRQNCDEFATTGSLDVKTFHTSLLTFVINLIKDFIKMIEVFISFLEGNISFVSNDSGDGTKTCFFEANHHSIETAKKEPKKKKSWKDNPNADKLQAMVDDGLLEPFNTAEVNGLKLAKTFRKDIFLKYEAAFGSMKAFADFGEEGILFTVTGRKLTQNNLREYRENH